MSKNFYRFILLLLMVTVFVGRVVGVVTDTILVTTHSRTLVVTDPSKGVRDHLGWGVFPALDVPVRKIIMNVTFACPDTMRCADWDYSDRIELVQSGGSSGQRMGYEIGRLITPYGGFFDRQWAFTWEVDVTDFSIILRDSILINYIHSGYEPNHDRGWLVTIVFGIITGTPALVPVAFTELYDDHFSYGDPEKSINEILAPSLFVAHPDAAFVRLRVIQTGHGMDAPDNCAEFCSKFRELWYDGVLVQKRQMWKKCGDNPVFPQAGTWIFNRGNWCPGDLLQPEIFDLPVTLGKSHSISLVMEPYIASLENFGKQVISAYLIQYKNVEVRHDVAVEEIVAPSCKDIHSRRNPAAANAVVRIRNMGANAVTSMVIEYGSRGFELQRHQWYGTIASQQSAEITLPGRILSRTKEGRFVVLVREVNGKEDAYPHDNTSWSTFTPAPEHGPLLVFHLLTNNQPEHNGWILTDARGKIIREVQPGSLKAATLTNDTFRLAEGAYTLLFTDTAGDGLEFWFNDEGGRGEALLLDEHGNLLKAFDSDCGLGWRYDFTVGDYPVQPSPGDKAISVYPAKTSESTTLRYLSNTIGNVVVRLVSDPENEVVEERNYTNLKEGVFTFDLTHFPYGRFFMEVHCDNTLVFKRRIRFVAPLVLED